MRKQLRAVFISVWELNLQWPGFRSVEDLISPHWAGISTLALAPGCCGVSGPVPSATLDKRCRFQQQEKLNKVASEVKKRNIG
jgi:hypothetical protein